ncbi:MAG: hypothetical protein LC799_21615, partial [Actinobacteria bacterium]|nr:hypothetical protein [Actinomycetota bacterium]
CRGPAVCVTGCFTGADARTTVTEAEQVSDEMNAGSAAWRNRSPLNGTDLTDFLALRQVCGHPDSRLDQVGEHFVENQRPVLPFLADGLVALIEVGHVTLGTDSASGGRRPVMVTASGRARYEELCARQSIPPYPPVVIDGTPD